MLLLKKLIVDQLISELIRKVSIDEIDVEKGVVRSTISANNRRSKEYSLVDLLANKNVTIASQMLREGYLLVQIKGGYLVVSPTGSEYQIVDEQCSCPDFVVARNNQSQCKHLIFRDWHIDYQRRIEQYKLNRL